MFLNNLEFKQKEVFLGIAKEILIVYGIRDQTEEDYLRSICAEMSLSQTDGKSIELKELPLIFKTQKEKNLVMVELIALAFLNGEYHEKEKKYINKVVSVFEMQASSIKEIERLVNRFFSVQKAIVSFISSNEDV